MNPDSTLFVVAYDITDDRRRTRLHKLLSKYGDGVQYSLFECSISHSRFDQLLGEVERVIEPREDSVRYYELCRGCLRAIKSIGRMPDPIPKAVFLL